MLLESERLLMRPVRSCDAECLYRLHTDPLVVGLILNGKPLTRAQSDTRLDLYLGEWDRLGFGFWMVYERQGNGDLHFVGRCGLRDFDGQDVELGYCFSTRGSGRGLATEAAQTVIDAAFTRIGLKRLVAVVRPENVRSQRILDKLGFRYAGVKLHHDVSFRFYCHDNPLLRPCPEAARLSDTGADAALEP